MVSGFTLYSLTDKKNISPIVANLASPTKKFRGKIKYGIIR